MRPKKPMTRALQIVILTLVAGLASAQEAPGSTGDDPLAGRLRDLEAQRLLDREYRACAARGDESGAARALVKILQLVFIAPQPFTSEQDSAEQVRKLTRKLRLKIEREARRKIESAGEPAAPTGVVEFLEQAVREAYRGDNLSKIFSGLLKSTASKKTDGFTMKYQWGRRLRDILPHFPCDAGRLGGAQKKTVNEEWKAASMTARRDFLRNALLEARAFQARVAFLDLPGKPSTSSGAKSARQVDPDLLQLGPAEFAGSWVTTIVTVAKPEKSEKPEKAYSTPALPFSGVLHFEELDSQLMTVWFYDEKSQAALVDAGRMKIAPHLNRWARGYPGRSLRKIISKLTPGAKVEILARVLEHKGGAPGHVLEVWKVDVVK